MRPSLAWLAALLLPLSAACSGVFNTTSPQDPLPAEIAELPGPKDGPGLAAPASPFEELPGVDTSKLSERERGLYWRLVSTLYAPCQAEAVSLAQCVKDKRACAACVPAADLVAAKVHEGANAEQGRAVYALRFGPNPKKIDLTDSPARGPANAPVTIVEWFDFECPHCKLAGPMLDRVAERHPKDVRLVKKFFPLHAHARAEPAAKAAVAAMNQNKYWDYERALFDHQQDLGDADLEKYAKDLNLDLARFKADAASDRTAKLIARDQADAEKLGLTGTPFIMINGREFDLSVFHMESDLEPWIDLEIKLAHAK